MRMSWGRGSNRCKTLGVDAQQGDRMQGVRGNRATLGCHGVGSTPHTPCVSFWPETSTVRKCRWPGNRRVASEV